MQAVLANKKRALQNDLLKIAIVFFLISLLMFFITPHLQSFLVSRVSDDYGISSSSLDVVKSLPKAFAFYSLIIFVCYLFYKLFQRSSRLSMGLNKIYQQIAYDEKFKVFRQKNLLWLTLILSLILFVSYYHYINHMFINDDFAFLMRAQNFHSWKELPQLILHKGKFYQRMDGARLWPMVDVMFLIFRFILPQDPTSYHLVSILSHIVNCILVYLIAFQLVKSKFIAFWTTFIFATRTAFVQPIYFTALQTTRQMSLFFLLSFYFYIKSESVTYRLVSILAFILAIASKEPPIILPALLFLYEITIKSSLRINFQKLIAILKKIWPYITISCVHFIINFYRIKSGFIAEKGAYSLGIGLNVVRNLLKYLTIPFNSNYDPLLLLLVLSVAFFLMKRPIKANNNEININFNMLFIFCIGWFFISLLPYIFLEAWTQEYFVYLPLVLGSVLLAILIYLFKTKISRNSPVLAAVFSFMMFWGIVSAYAVEFNSDHITQRWFIISGKIVKECTEDLMKMYPQLPKGAKVYIVQGDSAQELYGFWSNTQGGQLLNWLYNDPELKPSLVYAKDKATLQKLKGEKFILLYKNRRLYPYKSEN